MPHEGNVIVIDDHESVRCSLRALLETADYQVKDYATAIAFLADGPPAPGACLIVDVRMPGMSGLELLKELRKRNIRIPLIVVTGHADILMAVQAMRAGALDFLEKPFDGDVLLASVKRAFEESLRTRDVDADAKIATIALAQLTTRERDVLRELTLGKSNKVIAYHLDISARTVEIHRLHLQRKLNARCLADLVRTVHAAGQTA